MENRCVMTKAVFYARSFVAILLGISFVGNLLRAGGSQQTCVFFAMPKPNHRICTQILAPKLLGHRLNSTMFGIGRPMSFLTDCDPCCRNKIIPFSFFGRSTNFCHLQSYCNVSLLFIVWDCDPLYWGSCESKFLVKCSPCARSLVGTAWLLHWLHQTVQHAQFQPGHPADHHWIIVVFVCLV